MDDKMTISKIKKGTVIDHIPGGRALQILNVLGMEKLRDSVMSIATNQESRRMKLKDIVKVEGIELDQNTVNKIAVIAPRATINIVKEYSVARKSNVSVPDELISVMRCLNENCVSNHEEIEPRFRVESKKPLKARCFYCERTISEEQVLKAV